MYLQIKSTDGRILKIIRARTSYVHNGKIIFSNGSSMPVGTDVQYVPIPDQDIGHLYGDNVDLIESYYPRDVEIYTNTELQAGIDAHTERRINDRVHSFAPNGEQLGILRAQLVSIVNELGLSTIPEFDALNQIASEEIQAGQDEKASL